MWRRSAPSPDSSGALFICDFFLGKDKQPLATLDSYSHTHSLTHILIIHSYNSNTQGQRSPFTPLQRRGLVHGSLCATTRCLRNFEDEAAGFFNAHLFMFADSPSLVSFSSEAGVKVFRRYTLAHIQRCREFR